MTWVDVARRNSRHLNTTIRVVFILLLVSAVTVVAFPNQGPAVGPLASLIGFLSTGVVIWKKTGELAGRDRTAWRMIGAGFFTASAGMLAFAVGDLVSGPLAAFGPFDLLFIAAYAITLIGFAFLPHQSEGRTQRLKTYLDGLVGAVSVTVIAWILFLDDMLSSLARASGWERWAGSVYPILDVGAFVMLIVIVSRRSALRFDPRLLLFGLGLAAQCVADLLYLQRGIGMSFAETQPYFVGFIIAAAFYLAAATMVDRTPKRKEYADRPTAAWSMVGPYAAAVAMVAVVGAHLATIDLPLGTRYLLRLVLFLMVLVILRQAVAIHENSRVVQRQRAELVASVSHELRTPLTSIVGYLDLLHDPTAHLTPAERDELTAIASQQAHYMAALVSDLVDGGADGVNIEPMDRLEDMTTLVLRSIQGVETGAVRVSHEVDPGLEAMVDARRIQQIVANLLSNAVRYGGNAALVRAVRRSADLHLEVHDNGPGVPKKWELAIWDRFERGPQRFNATRGGTGLGLAVVRDITAAYGGVADCSPSERLGGACFRVVLPNRVVRRALVGPLVLAEMARSGVPEGERVGLVSGV